ncbi:hypothetical protein VP01_2742g1 [Puccinia sorghi]|uniref:Uncharacterized protein n=1 Tax=Puccinia sorghi TaxID=27349 RepID=A0A0L6V4Y1_9BASI|nr:hypothetical protein VP01_2742g1 [Puccinia sorghi]
MTMMNAVFVQKRKWVKIVFRNHTRCGTCPKICCPGFCYLDRQSSAEYTYRVSTRASMSPYKMIEQILPMVNAWNEHICPDGTYITRPKVKAMCTQCLARCEKLKYFSDFLDLHTKQCTANIFLAIKISCKSSSIIYPVVTDLPSTKIKLCVSFPAIIAFRICAHSESTLYLACFQIDCKMTSILCAPHSGENNYLCGIRHTASSIISKLFARHTWTQWQGSVLVSRVPLRRLFKMPGDVSSRSSRIENTSLQTKSSSVYIESFVYMIAKLKKEHMALLCPYEFIDLKLNQVQSHLCSHLHCIAITSASGINISHYITPVKSVLKPLRTKQSTPPQSFHCGISHPSLPNPTSWCLCPFHTCPLLFQVMNFNPIPHDCNHDTSRNGWYSFPRFRIENPLPCSWGIVMPCHMNLVNWTFSMSAFPPGRQPLSRFKLSTQRLRDKFSSCLEFLGNIEIEQALSYIQIERVINSEVCVVNVLIACERYCGIYLQAALGIGLFEPAVCVWPGPRCGHSVVSQESTEPHSFNKPHTQQNSNPGPLKCHRQH